MNKKGSYTVEAALVIPILMFGILLVIHFGIFMYNREAATAIAALGVLKGVQMETEGRARIRQEVESFVGEELSEKLILVHKPDYRVIVSATRVKVTVSISQPTPYRNLKFSVTQRMDRMHPVSVKWEAQRWEK